LTSYCSTQTTPCRSMHFRSPLSRMKITSRRTTYPKLGWSNSGRERNRLATKTTLQVYFLLFSRELPIMIFIKRMCAFKSLRSVSRGVWEEQYIRKSAWSNGGFQRYSHQVLLAPSNSTFLSLAEFSLLSLYFLFWTGGLFVVLKPYFPLITNLSLIYDFMYFIVFFM
jgi:hypothetical protein